MLKKAFGERLTAVLGPRTVRGGGLAADALLDLALADVTMTDSCACANCWENLTDAEIRVSAEDLSNLLSVGSKAVMTLHSGREVRGDWPPGTICVGSEKLGVDVDRPGLHPRADLLDFAGSNLDLLISHIERLSMGRPFASLGSPRPRSMLVHQEEHFLQWERCDRAGLARPQYSPAIACVLPFCTLTPAEVLSQAEWIVEHLAEFWDSAETIAVEASRARSVGMDVAAAHEEMSLRDVTYDITVAELHLQFTAWDAACRRGIVVGEYGWDETGYDVAKYFRESRLVPAAEVRSLHAVGAEGRISSFAKAVVEAALGGGGPVLRRLGQAYDAYATLTTGIGSLRYRLFWRGGAIHAESSGPTPFLACDPILHFRQRIPLSLALPLIGDRICKLVELPFAFDAIIADVESDELGTSVTVEHDHWLVSCSTGRIWR